MSTTPDCVHTTLSNGIHMFNFIKPTRKAIDEWSGYLDVVHRQTPQDATVKYVMDYRLGGLPPIAYGAQTARGWLQHHPTHQRVAIAFLYKSGLLMSMVENVVRLLPGQGRITVRYFTEEHEALAWLRSA